MTGCANPAFASAAACDGGRKRRRRQADDRVLIETFEKFLTPLGPELLRFGHHVWRPAAVQEIVGNLKTKAWVVLINPAAEGPGYFALQDALIVQPLLGAAFVTAFEGRTRSCR